MLVTIHGPNLRDQSKGTFHVHTAECRDNAREVAHNYSEMPITIELASVIAVVDYIYSDVIRENPESTVDEYVSDFAFYPCTKALPYSTDTD